MLWNGQTLLKDLIILALDSMRGLTSCGIGQDQMFQLVMLREHDLNLGHFEQKGILWSQYMPSVQKSSRTQKAFFC